MKTRSNILSPRRSKSALYLILYSQLAVAFAPAAVRYVDVDSPSPTPPYTSWATAATTVQDAVDAAAPGDQILVTNGVYQIGGRVALGSATTTSNRVAVTKSVAIQSMNGPEFTFIQGYQVPGTTDGPAAIRCVFLAAGASLSGFTLTNGAVATDDMNGVSGGVWCESGSAVVSNCVIIGNSPGGAFRGSLNDCIIADNAGTGVTGGIRNNCTISGNRGGGSAGGTLNNCILSGNSGYEGGGAYYGTLYNCALIGNSAIWGGGAVGSTLINCTLTGNSASIWGGGADGGTLINCTVTGNSASISGGGVSAAIFTNCIVYYNSALTYPNYENGIWDHSCTTPLPNNGEGNTDVEPELASASRLSANSPCIGAGNSASVQAVDIDGEPWGNPPAIGCDEYYSGSLTGILTVAASASLTTVPVGFSVDVRALISGRAGSSSWDFGDGTMMSNRPFASHAWNSVGDYAVILRAYNGSNPGGIGATVTVHVITQPVHYVAADNPTPAAPYTSWATAANTIQDAVDAATVPGALVLVTNGVYKTGGKPVWGTLTNRLAVDKLLTVRSVNGPQFTIVEGSQAWGIMSDDGAVRCVYLTNGAFLSGFTLTNGATQSSWGDPPEQDGGGAWCESSSAIISNCVLVGNSARVYGGGAFRGTLRNCTLTNNSASYGGGVYEGTLNNCIIAGNSAAHAAGGAYYCTLNNCVVTGNKAPEKGGAYGGTLNNCTVTGNFATDYAAGGVGDAVVNNSIVYYNTAATYPNYSGVNFNNSCTTPLPLYGAGNISAEPQLASVSHLGMTSPCRGAGSAAYAGGTDIDGELWASPPSMGCDEYHVGAVTGPLSVAIPSPGFTTMITGFTLELRALIEGCTTESTWDFGDGVVVTNQPYTSHAWTVPGEFAIVLRARNESNPGGVSTTVMVQVVTQPIHYVAASNPTPVPPYTSWSTAATNIQDAVDVAPVLGGGALVLVTNGIYAAGGYAVHGTMTNRVAVTNTLNLRSVNGSAFTVIQGYQVPGTTNGDGAIRCVYLASGASLSGFTLRNGATRTRPGDDLRERRGGGVWCESLSAVVSNCVITGNSAYDSGGGAHFGTLNSCLITGNSAFLAGGGGGVLNNCTIVGNSATYGGGIAYGNTIARNSIIYFNNAPNGPNYYYGSMLYCCTTPLAGYWDVGTIDKPPLFADLAGGNFRLQTNSPCINSGLNAYAPAGPDLDGNPRTAGGTMDIGAYEFPTPGSTISYAWLAQYGLPIDGSADYLDSDNDRMNNWQEWIARTHPTNALSVLRLLTPTVGAAGVTITWESVYNQTYFLERATNLEVPQPFTVMRADIPGLGATTSYTDTEAFGPGPFFYRVGVR